MTLAEAFERFKKLVEINPEMVTEITAKEKLIREALVDAGVNWVACTSGRELSTHDTL